MAENGPKNIANEFILTEGEEETTTEEKSWSDEGEQRKTKEEKKKQLKSNNDESDDLIACPGCIMDGYQPQDGINKCPPNTVGKRCKEHWDTDYAEVLEWMETCIGCVMSESDVWSKCPPNTICHLCKNNDGITYEEARNGKLEVMMDSIHLNTKKEMLTWY